MDAWQIRPIDSTNVTGLISPNIYAIHFGYTIFQARVVAKELALFIYGKRHPEVASVMLGRVTKAGWHLFGLSLHNVVLYLVFLNNQPLLFDMRRSLDMMMII